MAAVRARRSRVPSVAGEARGASVRDARRTLSACGFNWRRRSRTGALAGIMESGRDPECGSARPMPSYEITFRDAARPEIVHADRVRRTRTAVVFYEVQLVVLTPREIVVRRFTATEVAAVRDPRAGPGDGESGRLPGGTHPAAAVPSPPGTPVPAADLARAVHRRLRVTRAGRQIPGPCQPHRRGVDRVRRHSSHSANPKPANQIK
jgi:hypothetical protein